MFNCFLFNLFVLLLELGFLNNVVHCILAILSKILERVPVDAPERRDGHEGLLDVSGEALQDDVLEGQEEV